MASDRVEDPDDFIPLNSTTSHSATSSASRFNNNFRARGRGRYNARYNGQGRGQGRRGGRSSWDGQNSNRNWQGNRSGESFGRGGRGYNRGQSRFHNGSRGRMNNRSNNNRYRNQNVSNSNQLFEANPVFFEQISQKADSNIPQGLKNESNFVTDKGGSNILNIAVQGCCHGKLDQIYHTLQEEERRREIKIDLLICCGDMQTLRNESDFHSLAVPDKYKEIGTFYKYYSGELVAPIPTIFVGGNHEASLPLQELFYGGWVAPNIYYMGNAGVVNFGGIRIAGLSGIYKSHDYDRGHHERPPYDRGSLRSVYHVRRTEVYRLCQLTESVDIMISHDWPRGIERYGDVQKLLRQKKFFREEVQSNTLGSPAAEEILFKMEPKRWFAAHLHVKFEATVVHRRNDISVGTDTDATSSTTVRMSDKDATAATTEEAKTKFVGMESDNCNNNDSVESLTEQMTKFLSLDKCLPKRSFLQIVQVERPANLKSKDDNTVHDNLNHPPTLSYDLEWLCILRKTAQLTQSSKGIIQCPQQSTQVTAEDKQYVMERLNSRMKEKERVKESEPFSSALDPLVIPKNFQITAPPYGEPNSRRSINGGKMLGNSQTDELLDLLGLSHVVTVPYNETAAVGDMGDTTFTNTQISPSNQEPTSVGDDDEIELEDDEEESNPDQQVAEDAKEDGISEINGEQNESAPLAEHTSLTEELRQITDKSYANEEETNDSNTKLPECGGATEDTQQSKKPRVGSLDGSSLS